MAEETFYFCLPFSVSYETTKREYSIVLPQEIILTFLNLQNNLALQFSFSDSLSYVFRSRMILIDVFCFLKFTLRHVLRAKAPLSISLVKCFSKRMRATRETAHQVWLVSSLFRPISKHVAGTGAKGGLMLPWTVTKNILEILQAVNINTMHISCIFIFLKLQSNSMIHLLNFRSCTSK